MKYLILVNFLLIKKITKNIYWNKYKMLCVGDSKRKAHRPASVLTWSDWTRDMKPQPVVMPWATSDLWLVASLNQNDWLTSGSMANTLALKSTLTTQSTLSNMPRSPIHTHTYKHFFSVHKCCWSNINTHLCSEACGLETTGLLISVCCEAGPLTVDGF